MVDSLIRRIEGLGNPRVLVVGDLILDSYIWGDVGRISPEAPVPVLRSERREYRLGGGASVAAMLQTLGARVHLIGGVGDDTEGSILRGLLSQAGIDDRGVLPLVGRPTTHKIRYIGRAQGRHPQQILRVDHESCEPAGRDDEAFWIARFRTELAQAAIVLVADYGKGVCTPGLLRALIAEARAAGVRVLVDPVRSADSTRYAGAHAITPNRPEAEAATGMTIRTPVDGLAAGRLLVKRLGLEAAFVTLDRDGIALVREDGGCAHLPTRPRQVYDITGAGDMVLAMIGLSLASGADFEEAAILGNVAGGLEVERIGVVPLTRREILRDLQGGGRRDPEERVDLETLLHEVHHRRAAGQSIVFTNGCFDVFHVGHARFLRKAAELGDFLIVGLNSDDSVRRLKGPTRPLNPASARAEVLESLGCVGAVVDFDDDTPARLIEAIVPDTLVKGDDYRPEEVVGREIVEAAGGRLVLVPLVKGFSTTEVLRRSRETLGANTA